MRRSRSRAGRGRVSLQSGDLLRPWLARRGWARTRTPQPEPAEEARSQGASAPCASAVRVSTVIQARRRRAASGSPRSVVAPAERGIGSDGAVRLCSRVAADAKSGRRSARTRLGRFASLLPALRALTFVLPLTLPRGRPPALGRSGCGAWGSGSAGIGRTDISRAPPRAVCRPAALTQTKLPTAHFTPGAPRAKGHASHFARSAERND
jgi:hypothetical protein